ncbi:MAG: PAS domain S-box protein [Ignavibacteriales bacterium]|nr:PAS domain S-box protein [Ignavibacteriales bacterium]
MLFSLRTIKKFRSQLGPVEQAQVVASTAVVVAMITIVMVRVFSDYKLGWYDFVSVITVGIFGFLIVYFTLKYGRLLEEQKQELLALNTIAEAVNRAVEIDYLLENALHEVKRLLDVECGWIYHVEGGRLVLKATQGVEHFPDVIIKPEANADDEDLRWIRAPRIEKKPHSFRKKRLRQWKYGEIEAWASVPMMMKDKFAGVIIVASRDSKNSSEFSKKQLDLMNAFANQIGVALENSALFERLRNSEERYMDLFEHSPDMYHIVNKKGMIVSCNQTEADRLGYKKEELVGQSILKLYPNSYHNEAQRLIEEIFEQNHEISGLEEQMLTKVGELIDVSVNTSIIYDEAKKPIFMRAVARDITEKKKLESKIIHAQRIDSIGNLAGGVAHDFNNILTSILGSTAIMKRKMKRADTWFRFVDIIETAAKRGAGLTRQLLTFARKSTVQFRPVIVNDIIQETLHLFERSVEKTISVKKVLSNEMSIVNGDDGQIQQAILNLLINARDAMPNGGTITVQSDNINFDKQRPAGFGEARSGEYTTISIADTGIGMDRHVQQRIFEPFFTTKDQGKGTGLGLSVVYGVVNSHNGFITVQSEPNIGSKFNLYFPLLTDPEKIKRSAKQTRLVRGHENVMVVDDEEHVGEVIGGMLKDLGYKVTVVKSGKEALGMYKKKKRFDVIVLDMNMPTMGGKETFYKLKDLDPAIRVIVSTGYSNTSLDNSPLRSAIDGILQKPYQMEDLSKTMREAIEKKKNGES